MSKDDLISSKAHKLLKFDVNHHDKTISSKMIKDSWWENEINDGKRCKTCWLRPHECYCSYINEKKVLYQQLFNDSNENNTVIYMHYHYQEIGRGPNTGHVLEALLPPNMFEKGVYGDTNSDINLVNDMILENEEDDIYTCVLYPDKTSVVLSGIIHIIPIDYFIYIVIINIIRMD
jgi:DTW domain-containing protein YfiP